MPFSTRSSYALELTCLNTVFNRLRSQQMLPVRSDESEENDIFQPDDLLYVERERKKKGVNPKLQNKFDGLFLVKKAFGNETYRVENRGTLNGCGLKLFEPCSKAAGKPREPEPEEDGAAIREDNDLELDVDRRSHFTDDS